MAGETPNAHNLSKRRKLNWVDDKSTNKIYASGQPSALAPTAGTVGDSKKKKAAPAGNPTPTQKQDDKSSDKYYANGGSDRRKVTAATGRLAVPAGPVPKLAAPPAKPKPRPAQSGLAYLVETVEQVREVVDQVADALRAGSTALVVHVKAGESAVLRRTRAAIEQLMTSERITEEQYHEVRLSYASAVVVPPPEPAATVKTELIETPQVDPAAFLTGDGVDADDPPVDTAPAPATAVDTTDDVVAPKPDDDDDGAASFLAPAAAEPLGTVSPELAETSQELAETEPVPAEPVPAETTVPQQAGRGRRSGRGAGNRNNP